jgi:hypothetical protein
MILLVIRKSPFPELIYKNRLFNHSLISLTFDNSNWNWLYVMTSKIILSCADQVWRHEHTCGEWKYYYYYYRYSALGPVWAETRAQSGDWHGSGTLHPGQVFRGSLPLLSPRLDIPTFATRCLHVRHDARDPSGGRLNCGRECCPVILPKWRLPRHLGIFYMPQIYFPPKEGVLRIFSPLKIRRLRPGFQTANLGTKGQDATPRPPKWKYISTHS